MTDTTPDEATLPLLASFGDSISVQYGPFLDRALADHFRVTRKQGLAEALKNLDVPAGTNVGSSTKMLAYLQELAAIDAFQPRVMLLNCGLHDILTDPATGQRRTSDDQYRQNMNELLHLALRLTDTLIWVRTTPVYEPHHNPPGGDFYRYQRDVDTVNAIADDCCRERGVAMIDLHAFTLAQGDLAKTCPDGRHFTEPIRQAQGSFLGGWVLRHLSPPNPTGA